MHRLKQVISKNPLELLNPYNIISPKELNLNRYPVIKSLFKGLTDEVYAPIDSYKLPKLMKKRHAIQREYLQLFGQDNVVGRKWLVLTIEKLEAVFSYYDKGHLPPPQLIVKDHRTGYCEYYFKLDKALGASDLETYHTLIYMLAKAYGGCVRFVVKNPRHQRWRDGIYQIDNNKYSYTLGELLDWLAMHLEIPTTDEVDAQYLKSGHYLNTSDGVYLKQISHSHPFVQQFINDLPENPYCSWWKGGYTRIKEQKIAITQPYIQPNHPQITKWIVLDVDDENALFAPFNKKDLPQPQFMVANPQNGHAHYFFKLKLAVGRFENSNIKPMLYFDAVKYALITAYNADLAYVGVLTKNPINAKWRDYLYSTCKKDSYTLGELSDKLDIKTAGKIQYEKRAAKRQARKAEDFGFLGRNDAVFNKTRLEAYKIADLYTDKGALENAVQTIVDRYNSEYKEPLSYSECRSIARSIARFVSGSRWGKASKAFTEKQKREGRKGGLKSNSSPSGKVRSAKYNDKRTDAVKLAEQGKTYAQIADALSLGERTVEQYCAGVSDYDGSKGGRARSAKYQDKRQQAMQMASKGKSNAQIAKKLGVSKRSVINWLKTSQS